MRGLRTGAVGLMVSTGATLGLVGCTEGRTVRYQLGQEAIVPSPELCEAVDHVAHQSLGKRTLGEVIESPELVTAALGARALQEVCASTESIKHLAAGQAVVGKSYKAIYTCDTTLRLTESILPIDPDRPCHPSFYIVPPKHLE